MSASEKLKALDTEMTEAPWSTRGPKDNELVAHVRNALPQIVAVVEAAENFDARFEERFIHGMAAPLNAALTALDEALS